MPCGLSEQALTTAESLRAYWPNAPQPKASEVIAVVNTGAGNATATVAVDLINLTIDGDFTGTHVIPLAGLTMSDVVAAIDQQGLEGWNATLLLSIATDCPATLLRELPATSCLDTAVSLLFDDDTALNALISQVTDQIERWCNRMFKARDSIESIFAQFNSQYLTPYVYPLLTVRRLFYEPYQAIQVFNDDSSSRAFVRYDRTTQQATLTIYGGANEGTDVVDATSLTIQAFSDAITAIGKGWRAEVTDVQLGQLGSTELMDMPGVDAVQSKAWIKAFGPAVEGYQVDYPAGRIILEDRIWKWSRMHPHLDSNRDWEFVCDYRGGYETIPGSLELLTNRIMKATIEDIGFTAGMQSERLGDYMYARFQGGGGGASVIERFGHDLMEWREITF